MHSTVIGNVLCFFYMLCCAHLLQGSISARSPNGPDNHPLGLDFSILDPHTTQRPPEFIGNVFVHERQGLYSSVARRQTCRFQRGSPNQASII